MSRGAPKVELQTTIGSFVVELYVDHAPRTCKNFIELTKRGYYDGTPFHRVIRVTSSIQQALLRNVWNKIQDSSSALVRDASKTGHGKSVTC